MNWQACLTKKDPNTHVTISFSCPVPSRPISSPSVRLILVLFTECVLDLLFCNYILLICFKGATFPWSNFVPIGFHVQNNLNWLDIIAKVPSTLEFNGVALTGWSRYSICRPSMIGLENEISKWLKLLEKKLESGPLPIVLAYQCEENSRIVRLVLENLRKWRSWYLRSLAY